MLAGGDGRGSAELPMGSLHSLSVALARVAELMDESEDVLILYSTSHGIPAGITYHDGDEGYGLLTPARLASLHDELAALVDAGFTPLEALRAATVEPARFLNTAAVAGLVKPGFHADVVLLKGNPLVDIGNTRRMAAVILRGKYHQVSTVVPAR